MPDNDDMPTTPRPITPPPEDEARTIQVPLPEETEGVETTHVRPNIPPPAPGEETKQEDTPEAQSTTEAEPEETAAPAEQEEASEPATVPQTVEQAPQTTEEASAAPAPPIEPSIEESAQVSTEPGTPALPSMSVEDLTSLRIAYDPQISPDGALIAFTLLECNAEENSTKSAIWLVSSTGGKAQPPWQISSGEHHDTSPRWSPDGRTLAFLSDRGGRAQIYLLAMNGGEAKQVSHVQQGVSEYSWGPDGQHLLAHSPWKPHDDQEDAETDPTTIIYTRIDAQWDRKGYKQGRHEQLWLISIEGTAVRLTSEPVDLVQSCWSPDGTEIAFCANRRADPDLSVSMALWVLTIATGQLRRLTPEEGLAQMPSWSPDGKFIAYLYSVDQTEAANLSPWVVAASGNGAPRAAIAGAEEMTCQVWNIDELREEYIAPPQWYPDSKALLVPVQEGGQVHLCRLDLEQGSNTQLTSGNGRYVSPQISKDGQLIALVRTDWFTPGDIWSMDSESKRLQKLTRVNDALLQSRQLIRPKRITWKGAEDLEIEGFLYIPPLSGQEKAPLILAPHGGPSLAWGDNYVHEFQVLAGRGYAVLAPNPRGSAGYGEEFCRQVINDWGGKDFHDLMAGVAHVIATEPVDQNRVGIGGLSYGGYMTNWAITQTNFFKAAVSRNGISSLQSAGLLSDQTHWFQMVMSDEELQRNRSALTFADRITTPLLLLHADNDLRCPFSESMQLFVALRKRKRIVELVRYPGSSHLMDWPGVGTPRQRLDRLRRTVEWFEHFLRFKSSSGTEK
jgi:dipeptidyl aminopeptidase/acylaminoacyl peptidase